MTNKNISPEDLLNPEQNSTLEALLELVIPKSKDGKLPGANEIGFHEFIIDFNLNYYLHDLKEGLNSINKSSIKENNCNFSKLSSEQKEILIKELRLNENYFLEYFGKLVMVCYYQNDKVIEALGLEARPPFPEGYHVDEMNFELLETVKKRGKIWRDA